VQQHVVEDAAQRVFRIVVRSCIFHRLADRNPEATW